MPLPADRTDLVQIFARNGVGFDTVDVAACAAKGILTTNTPFAIRRPVAVASLTHIFALTTKLFTKDALVRAASEARCSRCSGSWRASRG